MHQHLLCPLHSQRMRAEDGGRAKGRATTRARRRRGERALSLQKLGTRAVVAEALVAEAANVERAVRLLCRSAGGGDLAAAKALIPWLNQALGMPDRAGGAPAPFDAAELEQMSTAELERLVAGGRERRLRAVQAVLETPGAEG